MNTVASAKNKSMLGMPSQQEERSRYSQKDSSKDPIRISSRNRDPKIVAVSEFDDQ